MYVLSFPKLISVIVEANISICINSDACSDLFICTVSIECRATSIPGTPSLHVWAML